MIVSVRKRFPGRARKVIFSLWGPGLLGLSKGLAVVDEWVDVDNLSEVAWQALRNVDWRRDVVTLEVPVDHLDQAAPPQAYGRKIGLDAAAKGPEEGHSMGWPERIEMSPEIRALVDRRWEEYGLT